MTTEEKEKTPEQIWEEESNLREGTTAKAAEPTPAEPGPEEVVVNANPTETQTDQPNEMTQILDQLKKLEQRQRNVEGHIGGLKTAQQQLHVAMEAARKSTTDAAPTQGEVAAASSNPEKWEELKKDFPEWAEATEALLGARLSGLPKSEVNQEEIDRRVSERVAQVIEPMKKEIFVEAHLEAILPDWRDEVRSEKFGAWMQAQPQEIQALAASNDVKDAAKMLRLYGKSQEPAPDAQLRDERKQRLAQGTPLPNGSKPAPVKSLDQMTDAEVWELESKRREKEREKQRGF